MNKIFKTLKNHRTGAATAVSELQTGRTKGSRLKATVLAVALLSALTDGAFAVQHWTAGQDVSLTQSHWPDEGMTQVKSGFAFGNTDLDLAAKTYDQDIWISLGSYTFYFEGFEKPDAPTVKLNLDDSNSLSVFEQSQGFDQALVHSTGLSILSRPVRFSVDSKNVIDSNIFEQLIEQNGNPVALGRYIIGERAVNLGVLDGRNWDDHNDKGIRYDDTTFYTAAVLSELDIYAGQALKLNVFGSQNWGAHLTGEGGVAYVGDNKAEDVVTIKQLYATNGTAEDDLNKDRLHRANNYTGATTVTNVTLNLERETSLGVSGILAADNANIVEVKDGALGTLNKIDFTNTALTTAGTSLEVTGDATFAGENTMNVVDYFKVDNQATITSGSLSTGTAAFDAGTLEVTDATLTASSVKVTGNATATGTNTLHADTVTVDGAAAVTSGSLLMDKAAFKAGTLDVTDATLMASSVKVTGNATATGTNTLHADTVTVDGAAAVTSGSLLMDKAAFKAGTLDVTDATLTASSVKVTGNSTVSAGTKLSAKGAVKVEGALTMQGSSITADTLTASGDRFTLSGVNTISTKNGATVEKADVRLDGGVTLEVAAGGLAVNKNMMVNPKALLNVTGGLTVGGTLTLGTAGNDTNTSNFSVGKLKVGKELVFVGNGYSSDSAYMFDTLVSALNSGSTYNVSLKKANVEYASWLQNVGTTTLDQAHLTLSYDNAASLGHVVMTNTSGSEKSQNLLTLKSDSGFVIGNSFSVGKSADEDVIELSGAGDVTFAENVQIDTGYAGWIRMTGTTLSLPLPNLQNSTEYLSVSVGEGGTIAVSDDQQINLKRLGWAETSGQGGTLDLSKFDFSNLQSREAAITVQDLTVNGNGTIKLDESAVQGLTVGTGDEGDSIFDALNGNDATLVISVTNEFDPNAVGGTINVDIEGDSNNDKKLTGYFGSSGLFMGDNDSGAAAKGTWGYGTVFDKHSLSVTHQLTEIELLGDQTLVLEVDGTQYQGVGALLSGTGTLKKTGNGYLHLVNTENTWTGSTAVEGGKLVAEAGALGTGALTVGTDGIFILSGAQDEKADQTVKTLTVENQGLVRIGGLTTEHALEFVVKNGGYFAVGSQLEGRADSLLTLTGGTLTVTEIEDVAANFLGDIQVGEGATLVLKGDKDGTGADLSKVIGTGTIELEDKAGYGTEGGFTGTTLVKGGWLTIDGNANTGTRGNRASLAMKSGVVDSKEGSHEFKSIKLTGGQLNVGTFCPGSNAEGVLIATDALELSNITITADKGAFDSDVPAESLMKIDNKTGATSWLVRMADGASGTPRIDEDSVDINIATGTWTSDILQDGTDIGNITYESSAVVDKSKGIGVNYHATEMSLEDVLELAGSDGVSADSTLDLEITGTEDGGILVTDKTVTLAQKGSYGTLSVEEGATVSVKGTQTLAQGGNILGTVETAEKAELRVTGDTLTIGGKAGTNFAVSLDAKPDKVATLRFEDRHGTAEGQLFEGTITTGARSRIEFANTAGNFSLDLEDVAYSLENSDITFGPVSGTNFDAGTVAVDKDSTAYFDLSGKAAGKVDLSDVTGNGKLALNYDTAGGELVLSDTKIEGFTGTLAFANATATIGTDASVKDSALNIFATSTGKLEVGEGSVLRINNAKVLGGDGTVTPETLKLAGDLTISDRATLDFTAGVRPGSGDEYLGNTSGVSVNAINMNGKNVNVLNTDGTREVTVIASLDNLDFTSGIPSGGTYHGSILDMLGDTPDYPVLTLIENIGNVSDLEKIALEMKLAGDNVLDDVEFWQKNWGSNTEEAKLVAKVTTGVKLVGVENKDGLGSIAIGAGITGIDIVSGATLRIDASASESGAFVMDASITENNKEKPGNVLVTKSLGNAPEEGVKFLAENTYTGETVIDFGAKATVGHQSAFASSKVVRVGTMSKDANGNLLEDKSILVLDTTQVKGSSYENAVKMKAIELGANGKLEIKTGNDLILTGNGTSTFAAKSVVTGDALTTIGLADGNLTIKDLKSISGFEGAFRVNTGASVNFTVADGSYTWTNDVLYYTDARSRAIGAGEFVKSGAGTLVIDTQGEHDLSGMNLVVAEGTAELNGAAILGLETRKGTVVDVNGIFTTENLTADAGSVFNLNVVTGKPFNVKEGESTSKKSIWGLGENGSDGILVTGTASGTLNLAVTPKDLKKGAEESIQLVDANRAAEGFTVSLVDEKGAKLEGLTAGAYDYTLVRKDDAQNGADIFLSSIPGEDEKRNTTVTAGSYIGVAAAAQLFDISLHDRMSNRSWLTANADGSIANSFWVLETVSNERYGDSTGQIDVHDTASTTTVGSDILSGLAAGGTWYAGAMFSYATQDTKSRSNRTALESRADTDAWAAGLYAGWQLNGADRTGPYVDGWILWTDAESDVKGVNVSETVDGNGLSASIEAGWGFKALSYNAHGQAGDIYVEPHVSVTWFGYEADDVSNDVHDVTFEGKDNIRTKLGVKTYAFGKNSGGFSPYVELNWIHNTETYGVTMSNVTVEQVGAEDQGEVRAGADWRINDAFTVWGHFGITSGSDGYSNREASLGVRYNF